MQHRKSSKLPISAVSAFAGAACLFLVPAAALELHPLFTDHGVLQQQLPVPVWGWADPGATVTVSFAGQKKSATAASDRRWQVILDPLAASAEPAVLTAASGGKTLSVSDLLVGEVWVCSGQSNMAMSVNGTLNADQMEKEAAEGKFAHLRLFKAPVQGADERLNRVESSWQPCLPPVVNGFSATGFYFGRALQAGRKVPVGLIQSAMGGTNAFSWINTDTYRNDPAAGPARQFWKETVERYPQAKVAYENNLAAWKEKVKAAKAGGQPAPPGRAPREPLGPDHVKRPAGHYNAMIAPLQPFAIRGAIWYQGEANSRPPFATQYKDLMFALVEDWRADWAAAAGRELERRDFPFYLVQLPNFAHGHPQGWPVIREQMLRFWLEGKNTGMVVTIDVGDPADIHPKNKLPVGERLARFARANTYGEDIVYSGPIYDSLTIQDDRALVKFRHAGHGLKSLDGQPLRYFQIAGADGRFVPAEAQISGDTLIVHSADLPEPRAVRYAWTDNPENPNFANEDGLPASPFRTDNWEIPLE